MPVWVYIVGVIALFLLLRFAYQVWETKRFIKRALVEGVAYLTRHKAYVDGILREMEDNLANHEPINPQFLNAAVTGHSEFIQVAQAESALYGHQNEPDMIDILRQIGEQNARFRDIEERNHQVLLDYPGNPYMIPFKPFTGGRTWMG